GRRGRRQARGGRRIAVGAAIRRGRVRLLRESARGYGDQQCEERKTDADQRTGLRRSAGRKAEGRGRGRARPREGGGGVARGRPRWGQGGPVRAEGACGRTQACADAGRDQLQNDVTVSDYVDCGGPRVTREER